MQGSAASLFPDIPAADVHSYDSAGRQSFSSVYEVDALAVAVDKLSLQPVLSAGCYVQGKAQGEHIKEAVSICIIDLMAGRPLQSAAGNGHANRNLEAATIRGDLYVSVQPGEGCFPGNGEIGVQGRALIALQVRRAACFNPAPAVLGVLLVEHREALAGIGNIIAVDLDLPGAVLRIGYLQGPQVSCIQICINRLSFRIFKDQHHLAGIGLIFAEQPG